MEPVLSWHVKIDADKDFVPTDDRYIGTHTARKNISAKVRLWNNRRGTSDVEPLENFTVRAQFQDAEDAALLKYLTFEDAKRGEIKINLFPDHVLLLLKKGTRLSGKANNGLEEDSDENFFEFKISLNTPENIFMKENDLKNLYLEVVHC